MIKLRTLKSDFKWFSFYYKVIKFEKPQTIMLPMLTLSSSTIISINIGEKQFSPLLLYRYVAAVVLPHARYAALSVPPSSPPQALVWCTLCFTSWPALCHASCCLVRSLTLWERMWVVLSILLNTLTLTLCILNPLMFKVQTGMGIL